jgi:hypothetical protein
VPTADVAARLAFLDLLTNAMGAMLIVFVLVASKHFVRPQVPVVGLLVVEAVTPDTRATLGAWIRPRGEEALVEQRIGELPSARNMRRLSKSEQSAFREVTSAYVTTTRTSSDGPSPAISIVALDPLEGCYEVGIFIKDHAQLAALRDEGVPVQVRVWFRGPVGPGWSDTDKPDPLTVALLAPTSTLTFSLKVARPAAFGSCD